MFPRSQGRIPAKAPRSTIASRGLPEIARARLRCRLSRADPPDRPGQPQGPATTAPLPSRATRAAPTRSASAEGGHRAVHPELGTLADFRRFVAAAAALGMEVALDFAIQCAPDHPWVREHPEWFRFRPDGTIKYAENPPKKYEDIVNVDFDNPDREGLWAELRDTVLFWIDQGVRTFRVDNPHTKPLPFWEWLIREVKARCPEAIFLSEAFTRPKMMRALAKAGFTQSYTYFTWRNTKAELIEYLTELTQGIRPRNISGRISSPTRRTSCRCSCRRAGGRRSASGWCWPATLSPVYGIYNGFELCENTPIPGREEYLHSEKYEYKVWDWDRPGNIKARHRGPQPLPPRQPGACRSLPICAFSTAPTRTSWPMRRSSADRGNIVIVVVNLDPHGAHEDTVELPLGELGLPAERILARGGVHRHACHLPRRASAPAPRPADQPACFRCFRPPEVLRGMLRLAAHDLMQCLHRIRRTRMTPPRRRCPRPLRLQRRFADAPRCGGGPAVVQGRDHLPAARQGLLRRQQ